MTLESVLSNIPLSLEPCLDATAIVALSLCSSSLRTACCLPLEYAYRRLCLRDFLGLVMSGGGVDGHFVGRRWQRLYNALSSLEGMRWVKDDVSLRDSDGVTRRRLRPDRNDYTLTHCGMGVIRSGGSYFMNVAIAPIDSFDWQAVREPEPEPIDRDHGGHQGDGSGGGNGSGAPTTAQDKATAMQAKGGASHTAIPPSCAPASAPDSICVSPGVWSKIRADPPSSPTSVPPPKYYHTMTALADRRRLLVIAGQCGDMASSVESATNHVHVMNMHEPLAPLSLWPEDRGGSGKPVKLRRPEGWWSKPTATGTSPPPRRGHTATLLPHDVIAVVGGSFGAAAIKEMEVYVAFPFFLSFGTTW